MNTSVTKQMMSKHSLETLVTISKLKYFGHIMHSSDSMKKLVLGPKIDSEKFWKTVEKMISGNIRNRDDKLVQYLTNAQNRMQWRDLIYEAMKNRKCRINKGQKNQYYWLTKFNRITSGHMWPTTITTTSNTITTTTKPTNRFSIH